MLDRTDSLIVIVFALIVVAVVAVSVPTTVGDPIHIASWSAGELFGNGEAITPSAQLSALADTVKPDHPTNHAEP